MKSSTTTWEPFTLFLAFMSMSMMTLLSQKAHPESSVPKGPSSKGPSRLKRPVPKAKGQRQWVNGKVCSINFAGHSEDAVRENIKTQAGLIVIMMVLPSELVEQLYWVLLSRIHWHVFGRPLLK